MFSKRSFRGMGGGGGGGLTGDFPRDVVILVAIPLVTLSLAFFAPSLYKLLLLSPDVWQRLFLWQLITYPFVGFGGGFWFLLSLIILFMFAKDSYMRLGARRMWAQFFLASAAGGVAAILVDLVRTLVLKPSVFEVQAPAFIIMQGHYMLLTIAVALFATLNGRAIIYFMFVIPMEARLFLLLEILLAFLAFLSTGDFAGFVGICTAVGVTYESFNPGKVSKKPRYYWRRLKLKFEEKWIRWKIDRMRAKRDFRIVKDDKADRNRDDGDDPPSGPWVH